MDGAAQGLVQVSVITATRNRCALLERVAAALLAQDFTDFEWVVCSDGATDGTLTFLEAFKKRASFAVRVLAQEQHGAAAARNAALGVARGGVVVFCDDDLILPPDALARHVAFHAVHFGSVALGAVRYEDGAIQAPTRPTWVNLTGMNSSVQRQALVDCGFFDEALSGYGGEDLELGLRLFKNGQHFRALHGEAALHVAAWVRDAQKGFSAGGQAVRIAQKHGGNVAWQLGVHPSLLVLKGVVFNPVVAAFAGRGAAFEAAYAAGARAAWKGKTP